MKSKTIRPISGNGRQTPATKSAGRSIPLRSYTRGIISTGSKRFATGSDNSSNMINNNNKKIKSRRSLPPPSKSIKKPNNKSRRSLPPASKSIKFKAKDFCRTISGTKSLHDEYTLGPVLGEGAFGEVYTCTHRGTGAERAVKVLAKSGSSEDDEVRNEFHQVKNLDHPNLIKVYHLFESEKLFHIIFDLISGGDLLEELEKVGSFSEEDAAALMNNLVSSVHYIHSQNVCHRDLKPENILLSGKPKNGGLPCNWNDLKIIDFGLASSDSPIMEDIVGTPYYMAPQVLDGNYTCKADIWSLGIIAFLLLGGYVPFDSGEDGDMDQVLEAVHEGVYDFDDPVWDFVSEQGKDFVAYLLTYDEDKRPTAKECLNHPWLIRERRVTERRLSGCHVAKSKISSALHSMQNFDANAPNPNNKLKQATYALLTSQLLSNEERQKIDMCFRILDADASGCLSKQEVQRGFTQFYNKTMTDQEMDNLFQRVNFSGSGEIEYSEFVCACLMETDLLDLKRLRAAFQEFDLDGSGSISVDELKEVFSGCSSVGTVDQEVLDAIIEQVDTNKDGEIDFFEFTNLMCLTASQPSEETLRAWTTRAKSVKDLSSGSGSKAASGGEPTTRSSASTKSAPSRIKSLGKIPGRGKVSTPVLDLPNLTPAALDDLSRTRSSVCNDDEEEDDIEDPSQSFSSRWCGGCLKLKSKLYNFYQTLEDLDSESGSDPDSDDDYFDYSTESSEGEDVNGDMIFIANGTQCFLVAD